VLFPAPVKWIPPAEAKEIEPPGDALKAKMGDVAVRLEETTNASEELMAGSLALLQFTKSSGPPRK
jgi:hypothetical protein